MHAIGNKLDESLPHVRMSWNATDVRTYTRHTRPWTIPLAMTIKKITSMPLSMSMGLHSCGLRPQRSSATMHSKRKIFQNILTFWKWNLFIFGFTFYDWYWWLLYHVSCTPEIKILSPLAIYFNTFHSFISTTNGPISVSSEFRSKYKFWMQTYQAGN